MRNNQISNFGEILSKNMGKIAENNEVDNMMTMYLNRDGLSWFKVLLQRCIKPEIFEEPILREAMRDIEGVYKIEGLAFYSEPWGVKSPESLSNGMKALILLYCNALRMHDELISSACLGNNCYKYLAQLSLKYDFNISVDYALLFDINEIVSAKDYDTGIVCNCDAEIAEIYRGRAGVFDVS